MHGWPLYGVKILFCNSTNGQPCLFTTSKENRAILRQFCVDHCFLLLNCLSNHIHFVTNGFKRFSKTNSTDPRQRVPLRLNPFTLKMWTHIWIKFHITYHRTSKTNTSVYFKEECLPQSKGQTHCCMRRKCFASILQRCRNQCKAYSSHKRTKRVFDVPTNSFNHPF